MKTNDEKRFEAAIQRADDAFWKTFAAAYPEMTTGDFSPEASSAWNAACEAAGRSWIEGNMPDPWTERIDRYRQVVEFHEVHENANPLPDDLHESHDYALVESNSDSIGVYAFDTFGALCDYVADSIFDGDNPVAVYDLRDGRSIALHIASPVVTESEDQALAHIAPWDKPAPECPTCRVAGPTLCGCGKR